MQRLPLVQLLVSRDHERLAGPGVEFSRNRLKLDLGVTGEAGPLRQRLAQQPVGVLESPAFCHPRLCGSEKDTGTPVAIEKRAMGRERPSHDPR